MNSIRSYAYSKKTFYSEHQSTMCGFVTFYYKSSSKTRHAAVTVNVRTGLNCLGLATMSKCIKIYGLDNYNSVA